MKTNEISELVVALSSGLRLSQAKTLSRLAPQPWPFQEHLRLNLGVSRP
ncbi:MAG: hypothetical protein JSU94_03045 [Phycisphaerales bacterium]|nr:MAG: hypothetical protein JSU94_03045 [Phycisphaerales bacterium]